ncbi:DoxX family protein [Chitinophaga agrisoli]|uniref:DoxX family protein n=1 Tax=Chitinophaga agrisoli TaxID=2607653 RepID=A0A5B2VR84_9BACT|nr:DoxX family protein [Chitinophaga agrisoli]KAA2241314.1 DoxX family protein [Chitinophaga agrisoli]
MTNSFKIPQLLLRMSLGIGFLSTVSDRLGILGPMGPQSPNIEWGNWDKFIDYTGLLMPFLERPAVNVMGALATITETIIGLLLITGFKTRIAAISSCILTSIFALAMTIFLGIKAPLNFAVFTTCFGSLILAKMPSYKWSTDEFLTRTAA